jgi:N-sulfoglucosamine sulfohydrolase
MILPDAGARLLVPFTLLMLMLTLTLMPAGLSGSDAVTRPNVLLILAEDHGAHLGALGTAGVETPAIDAFAQQGVLFRRAYVGYPVCSASKACIMTGLDPHVNGLRNNCENYFKPAANLTAEDRAKASYRYVQITASAPTLIEMLVAAGYHTAITGKLHVAPNERFPYHDFIAKKPADGVVSDLNQRAKALGKPWFLLHNSIGHTHRPYVDSEKTAIGVDPTSIRLPAFLPDTPVCRRDWAEYLDGVERNDAAMALVLADLERSGARENTIVIYLGDHGPAFPHGKMTPYHLGLHIPLIIRLPQAAAQPASDALVHACDLLPTILDLTGISDATPRAGQSLRPLLEGRASSTSRPAVISEVTGRWLNRTTGMEERSVITATHQLIVRSRLNEPRGFNDDSRSWATWRNRSYDEIVRMQNAHPLPFRILREMDPMTLGGQPPEIELYDLKQDPDELKNIADATEYRAIRQELLGHLRQWHHATNDHLMSLPGAP